MVALPKKIKRLFFRLPGKIKAVKLISALCPTGTILKRDKDKYVISGLKPETYTLTMAQQQGEDTVLKSHKCPAFYSVEAIKAHLENNTGYFVKVK